MVTSCFLALECSLTEGSLALLEYDETHLHCLGLKKWTLHYNGKHLQNSHSDNLPKEIDPLLKKAGKNLSDLQFLAVGTGPGRWTGVRTAINVIRTLAFCLDIPIYTVNSLRICAEPFLSQKKAVLVSINGFKNQIYFSEFYSQEEKEGSLELLTFEDWCKKMKNKKNLLNKQEVICLSDLEDFYPLPLELKKIFCFKKLYPKAFHLGEIIFKQKSYRKSISWKELHPFYMRSP